MKKLSMLIALAAILTAAVSATAAEPIARVTSGTITIAAGSTNSSADVWLNTGTDPYVQSSAGSVKTGAGLLRSVVYKCTSGIVTNWNVGFYAYDGGVRKTFYTSSGTTAVPTSGRYDVLSTNLVYSGRLYAEMYLGYSTNTATTIEWNAIVE